MTDNVNLRSLLENKLRPDLARILKSAGRFVDKKGWSAYLVGGSVRDLLLDRSTLDLDILVEEHGLDFARGFARQHGGYFKLYRRFATAMVILPGGKRVDVTTTRTERYPHPGALPDVLPGSLEEDLSRRDFTINAMAVSLNQNNFGELVDLCGGKRDLKEGIIRVLHEKSFRDDPTRIFRAVRFQQRLKFSIEQNTERLIRTAVNLRMFEKVSPERLRHELELIFREPRPDRAIESMAGYNELRFIHPQLTYSDQLHRRFGRIRESYLWFRNNFPEEDVSRFRLFFGALIVSLPLPEMRQTGEKFNISRKFIKNLSKLKKKEEELIGIISSHGDVEPSRIYAILKPFPLEIAVMLLSWTASEPAARRIKRYILKDRFAESILTGDDLREMGIAPGPVYRKILEALRAARLDGRVRNRREEIEMVSTLVDTGK